MNAPALVIVPAPLRRRPSFWIGLCCVIFTGWVCLDSITHTSSAMRGIGCSDYIQLRSTDGILMVRSEKGLSPMSPMLHPPWNFTRMPVAQPWANFPGPDEERLLKPSLDFTRLPGMKAITGSTGYTLYFTLPAWIPFGLAAMLWGLLIFFINLRRRRTAARLAFESSGTGNVLISTADINELSPPLSS